MELVHQLTERADEFDILAFVVAADIVGFADSAFRDDGVKRFSVVGHIQPVADVFAFSIDWNRFTTQAFKDHHGNQLFRELIGAIVIRSIRHQHW